MNLQIIAKRRRWDMIGGEFVIIVTKCLLTIPWQDKQVKPEKRP
jgi:hypothetical protein